MAMLLGALVLAGALVWLQRQTRAVVIDVRVSSSSTLGEVAARLLRDLSPAGYAVTASTDATVTLTRRFRPWWRITLAVALFPIGLLLLVWRATHTVCVLASEDGPVIVGRGTTWARSRCEAAAGASSGTGAGRVPATASPSRGLSAG